MNPNITNDETKNKIRAKLRRQDLVEPELSYDITGVLFRVFNELGPGLYERNYQKAAVIGFQEKGINFR